MKVETGFYISLNDAIDILSLFSEKDPDGFNPQQVVQMLPRVWIEHSEKCFSVQKPYGDVSSDDLSKIINLCNCEECIHDELVYSAKNHPYHHCLLEDSFMRRPKIKDFRCIQFISEKDGLEEHDK